MVKKIELVSHVQCTGCRACSESCPTDSISFILEGLHFYPHITEETCISCGKCVNVCPPLRAEKHQIKETSFIPIYYCAWNNDSAERFNATSGGVGGALAKHALDEGWYVSGAAFTDEWKLKHVVSNNASVLGKIRGSKYLQSNTTGTYREILKLLSNGEKVLFIGTPCQTEALRDLVPAKQMEPLLTCEIICHGVNSPLVWDDYRTYIETKAACRIKSYNFRSKSKGWGKLRASYCFENGISVDVPVFRNIFHHWFGQHYMMRESCFRCTYRKKERYSDIVIGDFWGIEKIAPELDVKKGASVLIVNSEKAMQFISQANLNLTEIVSEKAQSVMKGFEDRMPEEQKLAQIAQMKQFERDYQHYSFEEMATKRYPRIKKWNKVLKSVLYHLHIIK